MKPSTIFLSVVIFACALLPNAASATVGWIAQPTLPAGAIAGGTFNNVLIYLCHAPWSGGIHPGKVVNGKCNVTYGGQEIAVPNFEWAYGLGYWAAPGAGGTAPLTGGVEGGALTVCRGHYIVGGVDKGVHPGKVINAKCNIGYGGTEIPVVPFEEFFPQ